MIAANSVSLISAAIVRELFRLGCDGGSPSAREVGGPVGVRLIPFCEGADAGEDAAILAICVLKISRTLWLTRPLSSRGERDLLADVPRDEVPMFGG